MERIKSNVLAKRSNGIYYIFYKGANGKRTCLSTKCTRKSDAMNFFADFSNKLKIKEEGGVIPISLKDFTWEFLKRSESFHSWKTTLGYKTTFNAFKKYFGDIMVSELTRKNIEEYIQYKTRTVSVHCGRKDLINIKASLNWCVQNNHLKENPASGIKRVKVPEKLPIFYSDEEFKILIDAIHKEDLKDLVIFAVNTGLRQAELINLRFSQINVDNKTLVLDNRYHTTKSKKIRTIPLNDKALNIVMKRTSDDKEDYIFTLNNEPIKADWLVHNFKKFVIKGGLNPKLNFHTLRHTFASNLVQRGVSIYTVSKLLGHADVKTTQIYAHLRNDDLRNAVKTLDQEGFLSCSLSEKNHLLSLNKITGC